MNISGILQSLGLDPAVLFAGSCGGILRALSRKRFKFREMVASPICGALAAAYLTLPVIAHLKAAGLLIVAADDQVILAMGFLIGTCAMWISDLVFELVIRRFRPPDEAT